MKKIKKLNMLEGLMYNLYCISSLGFWWIMKIVIKKAIIESEQEQ